MPSVDEIFPAEGAEPDKRDQKNLDYIQHRGGPILLHIQAWDVNCPQHITPRWTEDEFAPMVESFKSRIVASERENQRLRGRASAG